MWNKKSTQLFAAVFSAAVLMSASLTGCITINTNGPSPGSASQQESFVVSRDTSGVSDISDPSEASYMSDIPENNANDSSITENSNAVENSNIKWELGENGVLTISGTGPMGDYTKANSAPWASQKGNIKAIVIDPGITTVGNWAFENCKNVTSVTLPDGITRIEKNAFHGCSQLSDIVFPEGLTYIGAGAFDNCQNLKDIKLPDSLIYLNGDTFNETAWYQSQPDGFVYADNILCNYKYTNAQTALNCKECIIKSGTRMISGGAFVAVGNVERIDIPDSVQIICPGAFYACYHLESIVIPEGVTSIGYGTFEKCQSLKHIAIPSTVTEIDPDAFIESGNSFTIHGKKNSYAEVFAAQNNISFAVD